MAEKRPRRKSFQCALNFIAEPDGPTVMPKLAEPRDALKIYREVNEGQHALLPCVAHGYPVPEST